MLSEKLEKIDKELKDMCLLLPELSMLIKEKKEKESKLVENSAA